MPTQEILARVMVLFVALECLKTPNPMASYLLVTTNIPKF